MLLSPGQLTGATFLAPAKAKPTEHFLCAGLPFRLANPGIDRRYLHVLRCADIGEEIIALKHKAECPPAQGGQCIGVHLGHILPMNAVGSGSRVVETTKQVHQSRLTGTRLSDNCNELAFANGQVDAIKGADLCVTPSVDALYVLQMQQGF